MLSNELCSSNLNSNPCRCEDVAHNWRLISSLFSELCNKNVEQLNRLPAFDPEVHLAYSIVKTPEGAFISDGANWISLGGSKSYEYLESTQVVNTPTNTIQLPSPTSGDIVSVKVFVNGNRQANIVDPQLDGLTYQYVINADRSVTITMGKSWGDIAPDVIVVDYVVAS